MRRCEPLNDGTIERELELQGLGEHDGQRIQIDVYKQMIAGQAAHEVSGLAQKVYLEAQILRQSRGDRKRPTFLVLQNWSTA